jgi:signal peptidase I
MRSEARSDSRLFSQLVRSLLQDGISVRFQAHGRSMFPAIQHGDMIQVDPLTASLEIGDVVLADTESGWNAHRITKTDSGNIVVRGDCCFDSEAARVIAGRISLGTQSEPAAVPRVTLGTIVRRWIARWRGRF